MWSMGNFSIVMCEEGVGGIFRGSTNPEAVRTKHDSFTIRAVWSAIVATAELLVIVELVTASDNA